MVDKKILLITVLAVIFCMIAYHCYTLITGWYKKKASAAKKKSYDN
jgi:hypothetical protein